MNRADRRRLSSTPLPGSEPVTVSRSVPVTIIAGADGSRTVVETDTAEPCYACPCCVLWAKTVDTLRASMLEHEQGTHALHERAAGFGPGAAAAQLAQTFPGCLVCQMLAGVVDQ